MCVLVVDDDETLRSSLRLLLEHNGYGTVLTASSGQEALDLLARDEAAGEERGVQVVLLDLHMPGIDGAEACARIKSEPRLRTIPVLVITGDPEERALERAFAAGASDYIVKPVRVAELLARLRAAWERKHELNRSRARERELERLTHKLEEVNRELERLSVRDELTGVGNRRFFNLLLTQEWGRARRDGLPLALVLIDVDSFKGYNDHYGHQQGDECLRRVAAALHGVVRRPADYLARYGGEEFAVILPHTGPDGAAAVAELLRARVEALELEHRASPRGLVTISLGVATALPERHGAAESLVVAADRALYQAKRCGRNRVEVYRGLVDGSETQCPTSPGRQW